MPRVLLWVIAAIYYSSLVLAGCGSPVPSAPGDVTPPHTTAIPAGGIFRDVPPEIRLVANEDATIFYAWDDTTLLHSLYVLDVTTPAQPRLLSTTPHGGADIYSAGQML